MPMPWAKHNAYWLASAQLGLATEDLPGAIYTHGAVEIMNHAYRETGIALPATTYVAEVESTVDWSTALVVAPPSSHATPWARRFGPASSAFASGLDAPPRHTTAQGH